MDYRLLAVASLDYSEPGRVDFERTPVARIDFVPTDWIVLAADEKDYSGIVVVCEGH